MAARKARLGHTTLDTPLHYGGIAGIDLATPHATADPARRVRTPV